MKIYLLCYLIMAYAACGQSNKASNNTPVAQHESEPIMDDQIVKAPVNRKSASPLPAAKENFAKKFIKNGSIRFQTKDLQKGYDRIQALVTKYDAYIADENQSNTTRQKSYHLEIKVPAAQFDNLLGEISQINEMIDHKQSSVQDVSAQYYDLQTRIKNKKALEDRYVELLQQTRKISEILEIEAKLNQVRTEIENLQGRFKLLSHRITYSTLRVEFYEILPYEYNPEKNRRKGFGAQVLSALQSGWNLFTAFILFMIRSWPFIIIITLLIWAYKKLKKRRKK